MRNETADQLARMRQAFSSGNWDSPGEDCPDTETLWRSAAGELDPIAEEEIVLHLSRCPQCTSTWRLAREMIREEQSRAGSQVMAGSFGRKGAASRRWALAAAAAVVLGVGLGAGLFFDRGPSSPPIYREQGDEHAIAPLPETKVVPRTACRFRWTPFPEGTRYDLTVTDERLDVLLSVKDLEEPEYLLPPNALPETISAVYWRVTAHLPDGAVISSETLRTRLVDGPG